MASDRTDIIIFHRNLRIRDNEALYHGSIRQKYRCIYIFDPKYWQGNGKSIRQLYFLKDCLIELDQNLKNLNSKLEIFIGDYKEFYKSLVNSNGQYNLYFNHSTDINYYNSQISSLINNAIKKYEVNVFRDFGVQRTNINRDQWSKLWDAQMNENMSDLPMPNIDNRNEKELLTISLDKLIKIKIDSHQKDFIKIQPGGSEAAEKLLNTFFQERCHNYRIKMSSPMDAVDHCSRLSSHFTFGTISMRYVYKTLKRELLSSKYKSDLYSFKKRLHWHCHFIQKLETEPNIEFNSMHAMCDSLRLTENRELIEKWILDPSSFIDPNGDGNKGFFDKKKI